MKITTHATAALTVLIVEDNEKNMKLARDLLRVGGFTTVEATAAGEGVSRAREHLPDLVLMDIQLPDFDGWEALRRIRQDPVTAGLLVVAVTAYATAGDEGRFLAGGFDGYLPKPIDARTFSDTIRDLCHKGRSPRGS